MSNIIFKINGSIKSNTLSSECIRKLIFYVIKDFGRHRRQRPLWDVCGEKLHDDVTIRSFQISSDFQKKTFLIEIVDDSLAFGTIDRMLERLKKSQVKF